MPRLDVLLVRRGLVQSRQRAKMLIEDEKVSLDGLICKKPSFVVAEDALLELIGQDIPFVGRGGLKLAHVLDEMQLDLRERVCMDIGASTGGFTDCMLQNGAKKVYAVDVGQNQLASSLRLDPRVVNWEKTDIRQVTPDRILEPISFLSIDVSFISLRHVLPAAVRLLEQDGYAVVLIKPQFEAGRENIGKHGLVLSEAVHRQVLAQMIQLFSAQEMTLQLLCPSPIRGGSGNIEYLAGLKKGAVRGIIPDIAALVKQAFAV